MTGLSGRDQPVPGRPATARRSLRHLMRSAAWAWLPRSWAAEWLVLLGLMLAEGLSRILPVIAVMVRNG